LTNVINEAEILAEIGRLITSLPDFGEVFEATAERISTLIPAETISLSSVDVQGGTYTTCTGGHPIFPLSLRRPLDNSKAQVPKQQWSPENR
jgi:hypothetical protein